MIFRRKPPGWNDDRVSAHPLSEEDIGELKLPKLVAQPPAVFLSAMIAGLALDQFVQPLSLGLGWVGGIAGLVLAAGGIALTMSAMQAYRKAASSPDPHHMPSALIETGPYGRTRNPLYLGTLLLMLGFGVGANMPWILIASVPVMLIVHVGIVLREESYLEDLFGDRYRAYRARVRRWV